MRPTLVRNVLVFAVAIPAGWLLSARVAPARGVPRLSAESDVTARCRANAAALSVDRTTGRAPVTTQGRLSPPNFMTPPRTPPKPLGAEAARYLQKRRHDEVRERTISGFAAQAELDDAQEESLRKLRKDLADKLITATKQVNERLDASGQNYPSKWRAVEIAVAQGEVRLEVTTAFSKLVGPKGLAVAAETRFDINNMLDFETVSLLYPAPPNP